jgi:class 3 adenylate cyclase/tetratricopeptide (TPR) repeat protein
MSTERHSAPERSIVTVLAADIVGSTRHIASCEPDDAQAFLDAGYEHLRGAIEAAGGVLVSYEGDGGIAVFGWPGALENHADQACAAAWRIQCQGDLKGPSGAAVQFRVGVHSGLVGLRQLQRAGQLQLNVAGAPVNISAKLQQLAPPGAILVSERAIGLCRARLELGPKRTFKLSSELPIGARRLLARPEMTARRFSGPMVGRRKELELLRARLPRPDEPGSAIAVIGEAGIGKSRLAAAAMAEAAALQARTLAFHGDALKQATPFAAARSLVAMLLGLPDPAPGDQAAELLAECGLDDVGAVEALVTQLDGKTGQSAGLSQTQISRAFVKVVSSLAQDRPTLLLVEDLHLVDPESRRFLSLLASAKSPQPLVLLLTARPEALRDARAIADLIVQLHPLPISDMQAIARQVGTARGVSSVLIDQAVDRADGVPFVLEELIKAKDMAALSALPPSVESAIHARLHLLKDEALKDDARAAAWALSLLGEEVEIEFLQSVIGATRAQMRSWLAQLEKFAFLDPVGGRTVRFRHQIIAEACARTVPRDRRIKMHGRAMAAINSRPPGSTGRSIQLALHAEGAEEYEKALGFLLGAADEARGTSAAASLDLIFERALGVIDRIGPSAEKDYLRILEKTYPSMLLLGEFSKMQAHLPRAMEVERRLDRPGKISLWLSNLALLCWFEGRYEEGLRAARDGLAIARDVGSTKLVYANQIMLPNLLHGMGRIESAIAQLADLRATLASVPELERWGAPGIPRSMALSFTCWILVDAGRLLEAIDFGERGLDIALRGRDPYSEVMARNALGRAFLLLGRDEIAFDCLKEAMTLAETNDYDASKPNLAGHMASAMARTGRAREAVELVEACLRSELHLRTAEALVRSGDVERGLVALAEALDIAREIDNPCLIIDGLGLRVQLLQAISPQDSRAQADLTELSHLRRSRLAAGSAGSGRELETQSA